MFKIGEFLNSSKRVFIVSKKPDWKEFATMAKITGIGIIIIAVIGFIVTLIMKGLHLGV